MKVCEKCECEIDGRDGDNLCEACESNEKKKAHRNAQAKARREAMKSIGMVRVRGALGGIYWE